MDNDDRSLLIRYFSGGLDEKDTVCLRNLLLEEPGVLDRFVDYARREAMLSEHMQAMDAVEFKPEARRRRPARIVWRLPAAIAAALMLAVCGIVYLSRSGDVTAPADVALAVLIEKAGAAKTVEDMEGLRKAVREAYEGEYDCGSRCNLMKLFGLGLARAITVNPKVDRQVEDLRFALERARAAGRTVARLPLETMTMAEAAGGLSEMELLKVRDEYHRARTAAVDLDYNEWHARLLKVHSFCLQGGEEELADALWLEYFYVGFFERGRVYSKNAVNGFAGDWKSSLPGRAYFDRKIAAVMDPAAQRATALAANVHAKYSTVLPSGKWDFGVYESGGVGRFAPPEMEVITQTDPNAKGTRMFLNTPLFEEAIFAGQVRINALPEGGRAEGRQGLSWHIWFDKAGGRTWGIGMSEVPEILVGPWLWFRVRFVHLKNGRWKSVMTVWVEGRQPYGVRDLVPETHFDDTICVHHESESPGTLPGRASVSLGTNRAAATWHGLGLKIIRPVE